MGTSGNCGQWKYDVWVKSIEMSPGCQRFWIQDDDWEEASLLQSGTAMTADNKFFTSSQATLANDYVNDIASYKLYKKGYTGNSCTAKNEEGLVGLQTSAPGLEAPHGKKGKIKKDTCKGDQCCWQCWPEGTSVESMAFTKSICWKGTKKQDKYKCHGEPQPDYDCHCVKHEEHMVAVQTKFKKDQDAAICAACGVVYTSDRKTDRKKTDMKNKAKCQADCRKSSPAYCSTDCSSTNPPKFGAAPPKKEMEDWFLERPTQKTKGKSPSRSVTPTKAPTKADPMHAKEMAAEEAADKKADAALPKPHMNK